LFTIFAAKIEILKPKKMCSLTNKEYLKEAVDFLNEFSWLFRESNTAFLKTKVLDHLPEEWCKILIENSYNLPVGSDLPKSLATFHAKWRRLCCRSDKIPDNSGNGAKIRGVSPKKLHEICNLTAFIKDKHHNSGETVLVDLGSGVVSTF
jgi:hypothetical protein